MNKTDKRPPLYIVATWEPSTTPGKLGRWRFEARQHRQVHLNMVYGARGLSSLSEGRAVADAHGMRPVFLKESQTWHAEQHTMTYGAPVELKAPDAFLKRGHHTCEECGQPTKQVLDGEAWCQKCGRYQ